MGKWSEGGACHAPCPCTPTLRCVGRMHLRMVSCWSKNASACVEVVHMAQAGGVAHHGWHDHASATLAVALHGCDDHARFSHMLTNTLTLHAAPHTHQYLLAAKAMFFPELQDAFIAARIFQVLALRVPEAAGQRINWNSSRFREQTANKNVQKESNY